VGSEGGSYADATLQVATFDEEIGTHAQAVEPDPDEVQTDVSDVKRYPNEEPE